MRLRRGKRFALVGPASKGRTYVAAPDEIDDELAAFVREAYEAAG